MKIKTMKLMSEHLLIPDHAASSRDWLKLELYSINDGACLYPILYSSDRFILDHMGDTGTERTLRQLWYRECGFLWDHDCAIATDDEALALDTIAAQCDAAINKSELPASYQSLILTLDL